MTPASLEVGGDGDDGVGDFVSEVSLFGLLHLSENHGGDLLGSLSGECEDGYEMDKERTYQGHLLTAARDLDFEANTLVDDGEGGTASCPF